MTEVAEAPPAPGAPPPHLERYGQQMESVQAAYKAALDQRNAAMMKPMSALSSINASPMPQPPAPQKPEPAPDAGDYQKHAMAFASAMAVLGAVAGRFTRAPGGAALAAFGGALKGWKEGNLQAYESAAKQWEQNTKATVENNRAVMEKYKAVLQNRKMNIDEQMSQIQLIATEYHDKIMYDAAQGKSYTMVAQIWEKNHEYTEKVAQSAAALQQKRDEQRTKNEENALYWLSPDGQTRLQTLQPAQQAAVKQMIDIYAAKGQTPQKDAYNTFLEQNPGATAEQRQQFQQQGRPPRSGPAMAVEAFKREFTEKNGRPPTGEEIQKFTAQGVGLNREEAAIGGRVGGIAVAVQEAKETVPNVWSAAQKSAGKGLATWNKIENKWNVEKGDENFAYYVQQMNSLINLYGRVISGGGKGTVSDLEHGREMLNPNMPLSAVKGALRGFQTEIDIAEKAPDKVRERMHGGADSGAPPPPASNDGWTVREK